MMEVRTGEDRHIHLMSQHLTHELQFALGDLNHLFDQASADFLLDFVDPVMS